MISKHKNIEAKDQVGKYSRKRYCRQNYSYLLKEKNIMGGFGCEKESNPNKHQRKLRNGIQKVTRKERKNTE